jgi:hypothetical protein
VTIGFNKETPPLSSFVYDLGPVAPVYDRRMIRRFARGPQASPIMISQLRDTNFVGDLSVNNPMLGRDTTRPVTLKCVSKRLRFTNSAMRIAHDLFDKQINAPQRV